MTPEERFWSKVDKSGDCWLWTGYRTEKGYGRFYLEGKTVRAHRVSYEWVNGPVPTHLKVDHKDCVGKHCVRPTHLQAVTNKENLENRAGPQTNSSTGIRGVFWDKRRNKWYGKVQHHGNQFNIGYSSNLEEVAEAVKAKRNSLHTNNLKDREEALANNKD